MSPKKHHILLNLIKRYYNILNTWGSSPNSTSNINPLNASVALIQKPVNRFAVQID